MQYLKSQLRALKARSILFRKEKRPIIIFALRRGGSTMLADAIAGTPGIWFSNEPFAVLRAHPAYDLKTSMLPSAEHSHFFNLKGKELQRFDSYLELLLRAGSSELGTCRKTLPLLRANRVLLKILNAPWMIDHIARTSNAQIVILLRHPAAQALSVLRQGWGWPHEAYFRRLKEIEGLFSEEQIRLWARVAKSGTIWEIAILDWIIQSHALRNGKELGATVFYEDIVRDYAEFASSGLVKQLGLESIPEFLKILSRPSGSSKMSTPESNSAIVSGAVDTLINGWKQHVNSEMEKQASELLEAFQVKEYKMCDGMPRLT